FGGDASIVGKSIVLSEQSYRVVGVAPVDFDYPMQPEIWVPLALASSEFGPQNRFNESYFGVARLSPGVNVDQAKAFMPVLTERIIREVAQRTSYPRDSGWGMFVQPLTEFAYGDLRTPMLVLLGAVGFVLLICCANVAGL